MTYQERVALIEELREYIQEHGVQPGGSPYYGEGYHREDVIAISAGFRCRPTALVTRQRPTSWSGFCL